MAHFADPDGNILMLHAATRHRMRADCSSVPGLPLPTKSEEHWRFTDSAGFDPDSFVANGATEIAAPDTLLDIDAAGIAVVSEAGIPIERTAEGIQFEPLTDDHPLLYSLVGSDEKFAAHNAALWQHGLLVHVPKGVVVEKPLYVRSRMRSRVLALLAAADRGGAGESLHRDRGVRLDVARPFGYSNAAVEIVVEQGAKVEYVSLQNLSQSTFHFAIATTGRSVAMPSSTG